MNSSELYDAFRSDVVDIARPYLWSDGEVFRYMADSYRMFVRLTGGVADFTSDITQIDVVTGEATSEVSPLILKFRDAQLLSTGRKLGIINATELPQIGTPDYGYVRQLMLDKTPGPVRNMVIGQQRRLVTWVQVPVEDDVVALSIYRLPLETITGEGQEFDDVSDEHHESFLLWMKHKAYAKQDAETFDKGRSDDYKAQFTEYCTFATAEWERFKTKVRSVAYGGI